MASSNPPRAASAMDYSNGSDPFLSMSQDKQRQRYSAFDDSQFSLYLNSSPSQAKRALQAHLAETTRRLQETSHLGNALVQQRKELEERLTEVDKQQEQTTIGPELRQRLSELEKEFNEVGRETARAFLPKSRAASGETDAIAGGSVFFSEAQHSPTKVSVPSRKQRNQQPSRIDDITLMTEISTSLLSQVKDLQSVLLEKDDALKAADLDRSQLEIEVEGLSQRLRLLDESESRLKDVNWSLETQVRESEAQSKSAADKEQRLNYNLNLIRSEKSTLERELEELKQSFSKLTDDHVNKTKQHETELTTLRRNVAMGETERGALQRKVEELTTQNQDLAKAVTYRLKAEESVAADDTSTDDGGEGRETNTPEHSPPPSPNKATPRHGILESETLKHSLQHAHRMIQQLKNNIHREKTEKIELKRMLQDARDELETNRSSLNAPGSAGKRRKTDKDVFKKPARPDRLGALRAGTQEILIDDDEWEEQEGMSPTRRLRHAEVVPGAFPSGFSSAAETSANEGFETANETSDAAFETANERDGALTETDAFQTGAETLDGDSSDDLTETEGGPSQNIIRQKRSSTLRRNYRDAYESTASTSGDEFEQMELRTPNQSQQSRLISKAHRDSFRKSTPRSGLDFLAGTPSARDSPASFVSHSNGSTPAQSKNLFDELNDLSGDDDDSSNAEGTPSRTSAIFARDSSQSVNKDVATTSSLPFELRRPVMMDSGTMTDVVVPRRSNFSKMYSQTTSPQEPHRPLLSVSSYSSKATEPNVPLRPGLHVSALSSQMSEPKFAEIPVLQFSGIHSNYTSPYIPVIPLTISTASIQHTAPQSPPEPVHNFSIMSSENTAPHAIPIAPLAFSSVSSHKTEPVHVPLETLNQSAFIMQGTEPIAPVVQTVAPLTLGVSSIKQQATEPKESTAMPAGVLAAGALAPAALLATKQHKKSLEGPEAQAADMKQSRSPVLTDESIQPPEESKQETPRHVPLKISSFSTHSMSPRDTLRPRLSMASSVSSQSTQPSAAKIPMPQLSLLSSHATEPVPQKIFLPQLSMITSHTTEPLTPKFVASKLSVMSSHSTEPVAPPLQSLQYKVLSSQSTSPLELQKPVPSKYSLVTSQASEPVRPRVPVLSAVSNASSQYSEPVEPLPARSQISTFTSHSTSPVEVIQPILSQVMARGSQHTQPIDVLVPTPFKHRISEVMVLQDSAPESPILPAFPPPPRRSSASGDQSDVLAFPDVLSRDTEPVSSRPTTAHRDVPVPISQANKGSEPQKLGFFNTGTQWGQVQHEISVANGEARAPLTPINNSIQRNIRSPTTDEGTQTMVSAEQIDKLLIARSQRNVGTLVTTGVDRAMSPPGSPSRRHSNGVHRTPRRPGSSSSMRSRAASPPPLPPDHKEVIAAAAKILPPTTPGTMGPPSMPASAYKKRPQTPVIQQSHVLLTPRTDGTTPRPRRQSQRGARSGASSPISRRSSLSSFTSEIDQRFNIPGGPSFAPSGIPPGATDPRMIQAITQTMIGEYLWKYTRKTGREGISEKRHRRFFWVHPYTRTLYWSDKDPQTAGKSELKAKSVAIESVKELDDGNPLPPGLHQKSLLIVTPGRSIKFTATTGQRHETWANALRYLCERVDEGAEQGQKAPGEPNTPDEIQDEFNGGYRSVSRQTGRSRASMSSYISRRTVSPNRQSQVPTLRQMASQQRPTSTEPTHGTVSSRISNILRPSSAARGSFSSRRSKTSTQHASTYDEPSDATMDLSQEIHGQVERDFGHMVNVRSCCDGKHDVGHLHHHSLNNRHSSRNVSNRPSFVGSMNSRSHSRAESRNEQIAHEQEVEARNTSAGG